MARRIIIGITNMNSRRERKTTVRAELATLYLAIGDRSQETLISGYSCLRMERLRFEQAGPPALKSLLPNTCAM